MVNDIKKQKILIIFSLLLLFLFVFLLVDSIIKMNKKLSYDDLLYYEGEYLSKSIIKDSEGGPDTYKILINGVDKPFTINNLVSKDVRLLSIIVVFSLLVSLFEESDIKYTQPIIKASPTAIYISTCLTFLILSYKAFNLSLKLTFIINTLLI